MPRAFIFLSANGSQDSAARSRLVDAAGAEADRLRAGCAAGIAVRFYTQLDNDFLANAAEKMRPADATIELELALGNSLHELVAPLAGLGGRLAGLFDPTTSFVLAGHQRIVVDGPAQSICYRYLMRRRPDFLAADYLDYYANHHYQFALSTGGISRYTQFYVDHEASRQLGAKAGLGYREFDSISELHIPSLGAFLEAAMGSDNAMAAKADELEFVDVAKSQMFTSTLRSDQP